MRALLTILLLPLLPFSVSALPLPFSDDFSDGNSLGWNTSVFSGGPDNVSWNVENGSFVVRRQNAEPTLAINGDLNWTDINFSVDLHLLQGVDTVTLFRFTDPLNSYDVNVVGGTLYLGRRMQGVTTILAQTPVSAGSNFRYTVSVQNDSVTVFLNNTFALFFTDENSPLDWGAIGLAAWSSNNIISFDNVLVSALTNLTTDNQTNNQTDNFSARLAAIETKIQELEVRLNATQNRLSFIESVLDSLTSAFRVFQIIATEQITRLFSFLTYTGKSDRKDMICGYIRENNLSNHTALGLFCQLSSNGRSCRCR